VGIDKHISRLTAARREGMRNISRECKDKYIGK
jgi:hypothetical protein